ncbi:MAG: TPM domain-containing protein [bacterium]|nr:TPM domain-containing protein [bacterium]MBU1918525.1 TPM domain-containing protein [bacterium]
MKKRLIFLILICLLIIPFISFARAIPLMTGPVVDEAKLLSQATNQKISHFLKTYYAQSGNQIQLLTINSLEGDPLEDFSIRVVDKWQLGDAEKDNGILFLIAKNDRKMRIEVGQGLEGALTDLQAGRIINNVITPYFKQGAFEDGILAGLNAITKALGSTLANEPQPTKVIHKTASPYQKFFKVGFSIIWFLLMFFGSFIGPSIRHRGGFWLLGTGSGSSSSGGFSGGGWSGGGGGFSGGGASGRW